MGFFTKSELDTVKEQLGELRPLPIGMQEFEDWSDRIISGSMLPASPDSQKFILANELLHLKPTETHKEDLYFIKLLIKYAVNQVADAKRNEIRDRVKAKEEEKKLTLVP